MERSRWVTGVALSMVLLVGCSDQGRSSGGADAGGGSAASAAPAEAGGSADTGGPQDASAATADGDRQVVTRGEVRVRVRDPREAADTITADVEGRGGRVDARSEEVPGEVGRDDGDDVGAGAAPASASLTVRVPSDQVTATVDAVRDLGEVEQVAITSDDVTGAAQDLDARAAALRTSVTRLETLIADAATTSDLIAAEQALTDRQAALESLVAERSRLAEQVSLSTLTIDLTARTGLRAHGTSGFLGGLETGWGGLVGAASGLLVVAGLLLPWAVVLGAVALAVLAVRRTLRARRRTQSTLTASPGPGPGAQE